jgi:hypothetical protein
MDCIRRLRSEQQKVRISEGRLHNRGHLEELR